MVQNDSSNSMFICSPSDSKPQLSRGQLDFGFGFGIGLFLLPPELITDNHEYFSLLVLAIPLTTPYHVGRQSGSVHVDDVHNIVMYVIAQGSTLNSHRK